MYGFPVMFRLQEETPEEGGVRELLDQVLTFLYSLAHWAGQLIARVVEFIVGRPLPADLIDPLGFLILLTVFLILIEVAKKLAWLVIIVGWVLILVRILLEVFGE